jgi:hypothetical protein
MARLLVRPLWHWIVGYALLPAVTAIRQGSLIPTADIHRAAAVFFVLPGAFHEATVAGVHADTVAGLDVARDQHL